MTRRVAVTGLGAVTPLGNDAVTTWRSLVAGRSGIGALSTFDTDGFPVRIAGQVRGFQPHERVPAELLPRRLSRAGLFGVAAAAEAMSAARLPLDGPVNEPDIRTCPHCGERSPFEEEAGNWAACTTCGLYA